MTVRALLGRTRRSIQHSRLLQRLENRASIALVGIWGRVTRSGARRSGPHLLLAAPGAGNVGDQAMFEAFINNVTGPVIVVVRAADDLAAIPALRKAETQIIVLPNILYGSVMHHLPDLLRLLRIVTRNDCRSLSVIGADVMDGAYNNLASVRRFRIPRLMTGLGLDTRVLGFSWNDHPTDPAKAAMVSASSVTALLPRDPKSAERLTSDGASRVTTVADLAFLTRPSGTIAPELQTWITRQRADGRRLVVVNANHGLQKYADQVAALAGLIDRGIELGTSFVLLPHHSHGRDNDEVLAERIWQAVGRHERVHLVPKILLPGDVATLASQADFAITGRMHLAILASTVGTPAIALSYQGKLEGLYRKLGLSCFVTPDVNLATNMWKQFLDVSGNLDATRETLRTNVGELKALAAGNVSGLA